MIFLQVLGHISYHILAAGLNGYLATVTNLKNPVKNWRCGAAPMTVGFLSQCVFKALFLHNKYELKNFLNLLFSKLTAVQSSVFGPSIILAIVKTIDFIDCT